MAGFEEGISRGWLRNITFSVEFWDTQCNLQRANDTNKVLLGRPSPPHVMFGPSCDEALLPVAFNPNTVRTFPLLTAGGFGTIFSGQKNIPGSTYYMLTRTGISYRDVAKTFVRFMQENNWTRFLLAYKAQDRLEWTGDRSCRFFADAVKSQATAADMTYRNLHLEDYEHPGLATLDQYIASNMTMLQDVLPMKNSR